MAYDPDFSGIIRTVARTEQIVLSFGEIKIIGLPVLLQPP